MHMKLSSWKVSMKIRSLKPVKWLHNWQPGVTHGKCVALLLTNVAMVTWIRVNCEHELLFNILCEKPGKNYSASESAFPNNMTCFRAFLVSEFCFRFIWLVKETNTKFRKIFGVSHFTSETLHAIEDVCFAIPSSSFGPVVDSYFREFRMITKVLHHLSISVVRKKVIGGSFHCSKVQTNSFENWQQLVCV